jgi:hypothetical protein
MDAQLSEEYDDDIAQDEVLAAGGLYNVGTVPGTSWKFLVGIGVVLTVVGAVLDLTALVGVLPLPDYDPTPIGSALLLAVLVAGILCLIAGAALAAASRRRPGRIKPIV